MKVYVSMVGRMIAVGDNYDVAVRQTQEMISSRTQEIVGRSQEHGEIRQSVSIRVCYVTLNQ